MKRTKLNIVGHSTQAQLKKEIQATLRTLVILRDGGCILRHYPETGKCGSRSTKSGEMILQAEHLNTRARAISFSDSRLVVCLCERHHIFWKPQYSDHYNEIVKKHIGPERTKLWDRVKNDYKTYKIDLALELIGLKKEIKDLLKQP